jgi:hypothetical protein
MKKICAIEVFVNTRKIDDSDTPITAANSQNVSCAAPTLIFSMRKERKNTNASGASMTTYFSAEP